ncbi:hypothetical protein [Embleya sp. NPDC005575]|uniref:hypothetical protein n=1 Tax=Embleya sp. NPDC005575 TaxID=3156892 RepID=UPI0033AA3524
MQLQASDVLDIALPAPTTLSSGQAVELPVESGSVTRTALLFTKSRGVTCVIAAGNAGTDPDTVGSFPDSGAVVVGGIIRDQPPAPVSFHVGSPSNTGSRVDCCACAGETTMLPRLAPATVRTVGEADAGTSVATSIVSGVVAAIQGRT